MQILNDWTLFPASARGGVLCVGNFDGVHIGHQAMLSTGRDEASKRNVPFSILTFEPHPNVVLRPKSPRPALTTLEQRKELLAAFSPDVLLILQPTKEFLSISAEDFVKDIVRGDANKGIGATQIVEGPTFHFGKQAKGNVELLRQMGPAVGLEVHVVPTQQQSLGDLTVINVSSTAIRWLIERGRVADAARALGRPFTLRATVVEGAKRGREIGFPTANLQTEQLSPAPGIYAGSAVVDGKTFAAAISVGNNPTFGENAATIEAYLLDFKGELYGKTIDVALHHWLRDMLAFAGVEPLVTQIERDVAETRRVMSVKR